MCSDVAGPLRSPAHLFVCTSDDKIRATARKKAQCGIHELLMKPSAVGPYDAGRADNAGVRSESPNRPSNPKHDAA